MEKHWAKCEELPDETDNGGEADSGYVYEGGAAKLQHSDESIAWRCGEKQL